jgi:DNA (cytosine-5)-methyltransferase 1
MLTVTDLFCGGGGSSTGAIQVPGVEIRMAANHWDLAVQVHNQNHPDADHAAVDLHEEDPRYVPRTDILWASPECTKWSQASGGRYAAVSAEADLLDLLNPELVDEDPEIAIVQRSRLLMFDVLRFADHHRYAAMVIENVVDIATNPKYADAWALWKRGLRNLGYDFRVVSLNSMHAQAKGDPAPQSRDRLYVVCWLKGNTPPDIDSVMRPLAWCPTCDSVVESQQVWKNGRTVGKYRAQYVYLHGSCGTTVEPAYLPAAAAIDWSMSGTRIGDRKKALADKTRRRIAAGIARYWSPFHMEQGGNQYDAADPKHKAFGDPNGYYRAWSTRDVLRTLHTQETKALVVPLEGRAGDRINTSEQPLRTQTSRHLDALVQPFIAELRGGGSDARSTASPLSTVTASGNHHALIMRNNGERGGHPSRHTTPASEYLRTLTANGPLPSLLTPYYGASQGAQSTDQPIGTLTTVDRYALIQRHNSSKGDGAEMVTPADEYLRTLTTKGHQSLITPGDITAAEAQVDDCLFRMLEPHEVAAGMAFPGDYIWGGTRRERVKLCGNAVTPPAARDLIACVAASLGGVA